MTESLLPAVTVDMACRIVRGAPRHNVEANLPYVLNALVEYDLADRDMVMMALATICAETGSFRPIDEGISRFNTAPGGAPYALYDDRADLGNLGSPDGSSFRGRGFIQLTGRNNYLQHGEAIGEGVELTRHPEKANDPAIAGKLLASFLKSRETKIRTALKNSNLASARRLVNGGTYGLDVFKCACAIAREILPSRLEPVVPNVT